MIAGVNFSSLQVAFEGYKRRRVAYGNPCTDPDPGFFWPRMQESDSIELKVHDGAQTSVLEKIE